MRNVFDQYDQPENRVTHALVSALAEEPKLLRLFLREVAHCPTPLPRQLTVEEQALPGEPEPSESETDQRGLPDAWIHNSESWAVLVESKVRSPVQLAQLGRHLATAERRGFSTVRLIVIAAQDYRGRLPSTARLVSWAQIYAWLKRQGHGSEWAGRVAEYLEIAEAQMVESGYLKDGTLTEFSGFSFGPEQPYNYPEAKRVLTLAVKELRTRSDLRREMKANIQAPGRSSITGQDADSVWDFIPLKGAAQARAHTGYPHLTLSIQRERVFAHLTIPHRVKTALRRRLINLDEVGFVNLILQIERRLRPVVRSAPGAAPSFVAIQRRYRTQRSQATVDALLEFDLRTALGSPRGAGRATVKCQPEWLQSAFQVLAQKRSNYQIGVGAVFPYRDCPSIRQQRATDLIAQTWIACKPLLEAMLREQGR